MLDFPNSPTIGQKYPSPPLAGVPIYNWDGEKWTTAATFKQPIYSDGSVPMAAQLTLVGAPSANTDAADKAYVDAGDANVNAGLANAVMYTPQSLSRPQMVQARQNIFASGGDFSNVWGGPTGANTMTIHIDGFVQLIDPIWNTVLAVGPMNINIDVTLSGVGGVDTGSIANGLGFNYFVIYSATANTFAGLVCRDNAAPVMPSGYTFRRRLGWFFYSGGIRGFTQRGKQFGYSAPQAPAGGATGPVFVPLAGYIAPTATLVRGNLVQNNNSVMVGDAVGNAIMQCTIFGGSVCYYPFEIVILNTTMQLYYSSSSSGGELLIFGWEDNL